MMKMRELRLQRAVAPTVVLVALWMLRSGFLCETALGQAAGAVDAVAEKSDRVTINVEDGSLAQVLNAFSRQTGRSMVVGPDVEGKITVRLNDIPWQDALNLILGPHGYAYTEKNGTIVVLKAVKPDPAKSVGTPLQAGPAVPAPTPQEPLVTRTIVLKYLNVSDVEDIVRNQLSPAGKMSKLSIRGQSWKDESGFGWGQGAGSSGGSGSKGVGRLNRLSEDKDLVKTKTMAVTDTEAVIKRIEDVLASVDVRPIQVLIEARFVEVDSDRLRDLGVEVGTGANGAESPGVVKQGVTRHGDTFGVGAQSLSGTLTPAAFSSKASSLSATRPFNAGLSFAFQKLNDFQFEVLLHMLEEEVAGKLLSAPRILTMNNQDATIIVGEKFPIIKSSSQGDTAGGQVSTSLDYYENIGIQLKVLPQVCNGDFINLLIHPSVRNLIGTESGGVSGGGGASVSLTRYPVLSTREAETEIMIRTGQTVVIGGLVDERKIMSKYKVPFLGDIPLIGMAFRRETTSTKKVDLLIFLTATIKSPEDDGDVALSVSDEKLAKP
jgi:type IV pilus assembly protein PilQ